MLPWIAVGLMLISIVLISLRLVLRRSGNRKRLRGLTLSWVGTLVLAGILVAADASRTFVAPTAIYQGYWYNVATGAKIRDVYRYVGGEGQSPMVVFLLLTIFPGVGGFNIGASIAFAKDKAEGKAGRAARIFAFVLYFLFYYFVNCMSMEIFPILKLVREKARAGAGQAAAKAL